MAQIGAGMGVGFPPGSNWLRVGLVTWRKHCTPPMEVRMAVLHTFITIQHCASWRPVRPS